MSQDDTTPGLAASQHYTFTSEEPTLGAGLPTGSLNEAWADQLREIEQANSFDVLAGKFHHSAGWLTALVQANVIDLTTWDALRAQRNVVHEAASERLAGVGR